MCCKAILIFNHWHYFWIRQSLTFSKESNGSGIRVIINIDKKNKGDKVQHDTNRVATKISTLSSDKIYIKMSISEVNKYYPNNNVE